MVVMLLPLFAVHDPILFSSVLIDSRGLWMQFIAPFVFRQGGHCYLMGSMHMGGAWWVLLAVFIMGYLIGNLSFLGCYRH